MPYFELNDHKILFIHIPKTGGNSIKNYFLKKTNQISEHNLISIKNKINKVCLEHQLLANILNNNLKNMNKTLNLDTIYILENYNKIITVVRNPYYRIISHLFFTKMLNENSTIDDCTRALVSRFDNYFKLESCNDNHIRPQFEFIYDFNNDKLYDNIIILKQETLNQDMQNIGFTDFDIKVNNNKLNIDYNKYLSKINIDLINVFYDKDFEYFGYVKM